MILYTSNGEVRQEFSILLTGTAVGGEPTPSSESSEVRWVPREELGGYQMDRSMRLRIGHYLADGEVAVPGLRLSGVVRRCWRARGRRLRGSAGWRGDEAADQVAAAVAVVDLGQAAVHVDVLAVGAGGHVAEGQRVGQRAAAAGRTRGSGGRRGRVLRPR